MRLLLCTVVLFVSGIANATVVDIDFDDMSVSSYPGPVWNPIDTPQGFSFSGIGPKVIWPRVLPGDNKIFLEALAGSSMYMSESNGGAFSLLEMDIFVDDPTNSLRGWYYSTYADSFAIIARDASDQIIAQMDISWMDATGWRTVQFDHTWSGIHTLELGLLDNCCNEVAFGEFDNIRVESFPSVLIDFTQFSPPHSSPVTQLDVPGGFQFNSPNQDFFYASMLVGAAFQAPELGNVLNVIGGAASDVRTDLSRPDGRLFNLHALDMELQEVYFPCGSPCDEIVVTAFDRDGNVMATHAASIQDPEGLGWRSISFDATWSGIHTLRVLAQQGFEVAEMELDNIALTLPAAEAVVDVQPWFTANEVNPESEYPMPVGIMSTNVADGDAVDFDAVQVDPATLRFGVAEAPTSGVTTAMDLDGDTDTDLLVGFNIPAAGIVCDDTELTVTGETYAGEQFSGVDSITTINCDTSSCHP